MVDKKYDGSKICFLDRDGTIIVDKHYLNSVSGVDLIQSAVIGLKCLSRLGFQFVVVSNQSGISRGFTTANTQNKINKKLQSLLAGERIKILNFFYCPHIPEDKCLCRKPGVGLFHKTEDMYGTVNKTSSIMVGDSFCDVKAAINFGITPFHILTGNRQVETDKVNDYGLASFETIKDVSDKLLKDSGFAK